MLAIPAFRRISHIGVQLNQAVVNEVDFGRMADGRHSIEVRRATALRCFEASDRGVAQLVKALHLLIVVTECQRYVVKAALCGLISVSERRRRLVMLRDQLDHDVAGLCVSR